MKLQQRTEIVPLSAVSINNMIAALTEAFDRKCNGVLIFAFCRHILPTEAGHRLYQTVTASTKRIFSK
jgi:hypothetical protein